MPTAKMNADAVESGLEQRPEWGEISGSIQRTFEFSDFDESMVFVNKVAELAEAADHHPDILIRYNKVTLTLATHDAGGITEKDFSLAEKVDHLV